MPLVAASVCSVIAVPQVNYCRVNFEAILLQLYCLKQMSCKLQKTAQKWKYKLGPLKVKSLFMLLNGVCEWQLAKIKVSHS